MSHGYGRGYARQRVRVIFTLRDSMDLSQIKVLDLDDKVVDCIFSCSDVGDYEDAEITEGGFYGCDENVEAGDEVEFEIDFRPYVEVSIESEGPSWGYSGGDPGYYEVELSEGGLGSIDRSKLFKKLDALPELKGKLEDNISVYIDDVEDYEDIEDTSYEDWLDAEADRRRDDDLFDD